MLAATSKALFHALAGFGPLRRLVSRYGMAPGGGFARRFIAGETAAEAIDAARTLGTRGFGVSLDYLLKDGAPNAAPAEAQEEHRTMRLLSLILCFGGTAALIVYGVLSILVPSVPAQISGSSMIRIDGSGIFLLLCVAAIAAGAALLLKSTKHK